MTFFVNCRSARSRGLVFIMWWTDVRKTFSGIHVCSVKRVWIDEPQQMLDICYQHILRHICEAEAEGTLKPSRCIKKYRCLNTFSDRKSSLRACLKHLVEHRVEHWCGSARSQDTSRLGPSHGRPQRACHAGASKELFPRFPSLLFRIALVCCAMSLKYPSSTRHICSKYLPAIPEVPPNTSNTSQFWS